MGDPKKTSVDMSELQYYFDAQERDTIDRQGLSRRSFHVLDIRDKLLTLPQADFESAVKSIKSLLQGHERDDKGAADAKGKRRDANELYDRTRVEHGSNNKVGSVRGI